MKVISGIYRGRNIEGYELLGTRPTQDRIKENIFNIIGSDIQDKIVLDLFSGTGSLGIEAASRGAKYVYFNDYNKESINVINNNIKKIGINNCSVIHNDYKNTIKNLDKKMDIILLDPPYDSNYIGISIKLINKYNLLNDDGLIVIECDDLDKVKYNDEYECIKNKKYGDKFIVILKKI